MPNNYSNKGVSIPGFAVRLFGGASPESIAFWDDVFFIGRDQFEHKLSREDQERLANALSGIVSRVYKQRMEDAKQEFRDWLAVAKAD